MPWMRTVAFENKLNMRSSCPKRDKAPPGAGVLIMAILNRSVTVNIVSNGIELCEICCTNRT